MGEDSSVGTEVRRGKKTRRTETQIDIERKRQSKRDVWRTREDTERDEK